MFRITDNPISTPSVKSKSVLLGRNFCINIAIAREIIPTGCANSCCIFILFLTTKNGKYLDYNLCEYILSPISWIPRRL